MECNKIKLIRFVHYTAAGSSQMIAIFSVRPIIVRSV